MGDLSDNCACKYCGGKKYQKEITASMSSILRITPTISPSPGKPRPVRDKGKGKESTTKREPRRRDTRVYAAVQKVVKHLKPSPGVLKQPMLSERNSDIRAMYCPTSMELKRWYREGEVVWCSLETPIPGPDGNEANCIEFWPAVVDEVKLKTEPIPRESDGHSSASQTEHHAGSSTVVQPPIASDDTRGPMLENADDPLPWMVRQSTSYKVQLLSVSHSYTIDDEMVVPYQAYVPPGDLLTTMATFPADQLEFDKEVLSKFNPCTTPTPSFYAAVSAYAKALQIASMLSSTWCLTDSYDVRYSITSSPKSSPKLSTNPLPSTQSVPRSASQPPLSLEEAIQEASRHNAELTNNAPLYRYVSSVNPERMQEEVDRTVKRVLGALPPSNLVQTRFQGLWWGAERIWTNDFIRLKIPRRTLAPNGGPHILPPSGPGESASESWKRIGRDPTQLGAGVRGVFLRLDGLITVDVPTPEGGTKKEARVCGMLYELADLDWHEPAESKVETNIPIQTPPSQSAAPFTVVAGSSTENPALPSNGQAGYQPPNNVPPATSEDLIGDKLPQAPKGYRFRPILMPGFEFVGAMGLISGRYYPRILDHPRLRPRVTAALSTPTETQLGFDNLWALEGLSGGFFNSVDPFRYKPNRVAMMQDADAEAMQQLNDYIVEKKNKHNALQPEDDAMDVDDPFAT